MRKNKDITGPASRKSDSIALKWGVTFFGNVPNNSDIVGTWVDI